MNHRKLPTPLRRPSNLTFPRLWRAIVAATLCAGLAACGGSQTTTKVDYSVTAQQNYKKGVDRLEHEDWVAAAKYFQFIKARFPYSQYAVLAELRMADAEFGAGHYLQAIDNYKLFIKFHPTDDNVVNGYASFRIGESYYKLLPSDFFLLPPSAEKDQSSTSDAHRELTQFLRKYPDSKYREKAKELLTELNQRLAQHEMYVARFYWERERPMGTVMRLRRLLKYHSGTRLDPEALLLLGRAYLRVKMPDRAKRAFERLVREHPKHKNAAAAKRELERLTS